MKATTNTSIAEATYTGRADGPQVCRKRPRKIDLELGSLEATSWWREDGYGTVEEEEESESEHEEESEEDDGAEGEEWGTVACITNQSCFCELCDEINIKIDCMIDCV